MDITFPTKFAGQRFRRFSDLLLRAIERISKPDDDQRTTAELASMTPCESLDLDVLRANLARGRGQARWAAFPRADRDRRPANRKPGASMPLTGALFNIAGVIAFRHAQQRPAWPDSTKAARVARPRTRAVPRRIPAGRQADRHRRVARSGS